MFNQMYLAIEQNKLKGRFGGTVTTAILEVLNKNYMRKWVFQKTGER